MRSGQRKRGVVVVERRIRPGHGIVAHRAGCREAGRRVRGIIGGGVILLVAGVTRCAIQRVVVVDVAIRALAWRHRMHSGQRKPRRGVIKFAVRPSHSVVTLLARRRKTTVRHGT